MPGEHTVGAGQAGRSSPKAPAVAVPVLAKRRRTLRQLCKSIVARKEFDKLILSVIAVNCITLLANNPLEVSLRLRAVGYLRCACVRGGGAAAAGEGKLGTVVAGPCRRRAVVAALRAAPAPLLVRADSWVSLAAIRPRARRRPCTSGLSEWSQPAELLCRWPAGGWLTTAPACPDLKPTTPAATRAARCWSQHTAVANLSPRPCLMTRRIRSTFASYRTPRCKAGSRIWRSKMCWGVSRSSSPLSSRWRW
jgi:hypothetical protein